jgi:2-keto-4-pentenoate hydratase/2-oxohepta-3-ene-1,7-dioic acid hydratase in catechol pathway
MFRLATYQRQDQIGPGILLSDGSLIPIAEAPQGPSGLMAVLGSWDAWWPRLLRLADQAGPRVTDARLLAPLQYPGKMLFAGANYSDHAREMAGGQAVAGREPYLFLKPTRHCIIGPGEPIAIDPEFTEVDWEVEVAVVIGRTARRVAEAEALQYVAGYVVVNDVTERVRTFRDDTVFRHDWMAGKGRDSFCPMGPAILPAAFVPDPGRMALGLKVNGVEKQHSHTGNLIHNIPRLISYASHLCTLDPGDVISTGTPAGVGKGRGEFLHPGDTVEAWVEGIGSLVNPVVLAES